MNPTTNAISAGLRRGWIEMRQILTSGQELFGFFFYPVTMLIILWFMRDADFQSSGFTLGALTLPSMLGMLVAFNGVFGLAQVLGVEREDGTLLRAKATPNGMVGYLVGKIVVGTAWVVLPLALVLIPGLWIVDGISMAGAGPWLTLLWVTALGTLAALPLGAIVGSMFTNPRAIGFVSFPILGLTAISGIFYPLTAMPGWVQGIAQLFPMYWLGLGSRSAMLPADAVVVEIGQSWRHLETVGVLALWSAAALLIAPIVLRKMARRESGSVVAARREKAIQRAY